MCRFWTENVSPFLCNSEYILHSDLVSGLGTAAEDLLASSVDDRLEERFLLVLICTCTEHSKDGYSCFRCALKSVQKVGYSCVRCAAEVLEV